LRDVADESGAVWREGRYYWLSAMFPDGLEYVLVGPASDPVPSLMPPAGDRLGICMKANGVRVRWRGTRRECPGSSKY